MTESIENSLKKLGAEFSCLNWDFRDEPKETSSHIISYWPGDPSEDVMVCVLQDDYISEPFHRQDFFFFNYAYHGSYSALSMNDSNLITVHEDECYIGQPFNGYALRSDPRSGENIIIGILIQRNTFLREYLSTIASDTSLLQFFLTPQKDPLSESFIRLSFNDDFTVRTLLELMVQEYANRRDDTQQILKPMVLSLFMLVARAYRLQNASTVKKTAAERISSYIKDHLDSVTLHSLSVHFSYHPNYISSLLKAETGQSYSETLLSERMKRAAILLQKTSLSIDEVSGMSGYGDPRSFYKAFRKHFGTSPRKYSHRQSQQDSFLKY